MKNFLNGLKNLCVRFGKGFVRFFKNLGVGFVKGCVKLFKGIQNWCRNFGKRFVDSSVPTKIGHFALGTGNIAHKQYTKGIIFLVLEVLFFVLMIVSPKVS